MPSLKEIRIRLQSVKSTRQITSAMKMVSAAKLRKAQDAIIQLRPYAGKLHEIIENLTASLDEESENVYAKKRGPNRILLVILTSNRGLCGGFNSTIVKKVVALTEHEYLHAYSTDNLEIMVVGKKGADLLRGKKLIPARVLTELFENLSYSSTETLAVELMDSFTSGKYDRIDLIYNQFKNAATQDLVHEQFLPILQKQKIESRFELPVEYILEPSKNEIIDELIPKSLKIQFFKALLDSQASEHGARMTAMHKATDNATQLIHELQLNYNKARQSSITKEILEITGGAEALKQ